MRSPHPHKQPLVTQRTLGDGLGEQRTSGVVYDVEMLATATPGGRVAFLPGA